MIVTTEECNLWVSHSTGKSILISDMVDEYLQSAIAMIKRGFDSSGKELPRHYDGFLEPLEKEAVRRGLVPKEDGWDE